MRRALGGVGPVALLVALLLAGCESAPPAKSEAPSPTPAPAAQAAPAPPPPSPAPAPAAAAPPGPAPAAAPAPAAQPPAVPRAMVISAVRANFRAGPGTSAKIVAVLRKGTRVEVLEERDQWYRVKLADGREGWIAESVAAAPSQ